MLDGSRAFELIWGSVTGGVSFAIGAGMIALWMGARAGRGASVFGATVDPSRRLHFAYAVAVLAMGGTNVGCRFIPHAYLEGVHETYAALTLTLWALLAPLVVIAAVRAAGARTPRAPASRTTPRAGRAAR